MRLRSLFFVLAGFAATPVVAVDYPGEPLCAIGPDGTGLAVLTTATDRCYGSPEWSPDGSQIAVDWWKVGTSIPDVFMAILDARGAEVRQLGHGAMPSWSPDASQIVCHTYTPREIVVLNADGTGRETILERWGSPRWCPAGDRIASLGVADTINLYSLADGTETRLFRGPFSPYWNFSISPDGLGYCFSDNSQGVALATVDPKTDVAAVRWLVRNGKGGKTSWSPDGQRVVVSWKPDEAPHQLYLIDINGGGAPQRIPGQDPDRNSVDPDWSPDGKTIVFVSRPVY